MPVFFHHYKVAVCWSTALLLVATTTVQAREPFTLIDSKGVIVGPIMDFRRNPQVSLVPAAVVYIPFRVGAQRILLPYNQEGNVWVRTARAVYFEERDCKGTPYLDTSVEALTPPVFITGDRHTLFVANGAFRTLRAKSVTLSYPDHAYCRSGAGSSPFTVRPMVRVLDLADRFTPPFRISASPEVVDLGTGTP